ncbi:MAG: MerR family transcriptional regulator [Sulfuriferula sp.]|nr:MerR family transcriptional regulator [Sulfuriferula sp.]
MEKNTYFNIAAVERDTGVGKDTLRVWERRYGFPTPIRDVHGERLYSQMELEKLRLVQRLMNQGHRPGKLMALDMSALSLMLNVQDVSIENDAEIIAILKKHHTADLHRYLNNLLIEQGLARFVTESLANMNTQIGDAWMRGRLAIFEEHAYSEQVISLLRSAISQMGFEVVAPSVLLTTLPGEEHTLGGLMCEALLALNQVSCVNLGAQTPVVEINAAVRAHQADILCLSCSAAYPKNQLLQSLTELRNLLPESVHIWVGGQGVPRTKLPVGIKAIRAFTELAITLEAWRDK